MTDRQPARDNTDSHAMSTMSFLAEPGIAVRGFTLEDGIAFSAQARERTVVRIEVNGFQPAAGVAFLINGRPAAFTVEGAALRFTLPASAAAVRFMGNISPECP